VTVATRPLIGLTAYREQASWGVWTTRADVLPAVYASAIEEAGGIPVLLPVGTSTPESAKSLVARLDGVVISGGADVSPERY
jgi:putative glutamine amidotransferase